jgi:photosystem II stability/assembly factor-like uncharacterized protein
MTRIRVVLLVLVGILALSYCSQARAQAKLLGDDTGWAIRVGLQWTNNDGKDWQQITLKAVLDGGWSMVNAFFLNTSNGWALLQKGRQTLCCQFALASTDNHGLSWSVKPMNLPIWWSPNQEVFSGGGTIDFVDTMHGWVDLGMESASGAGFLFSTDDGGGTWQNVKSGPGIAGEVRFITLQEGWVHGGAGENELYGTHDAGKTWEKVNLPPPAGVASTTVTSYYLPKFQDPGHGYLPVFFSPNTPSGTVVLFQTADGGRTWEPTKGVIQYPGCTAPASMPVTVADSTLFVVEQTGRYKTALFKATPDGQVERLPAPFAALAYGITLSFPNSAHGWAHGETGEIKVTTDGGQTWTNPAPVHHGMGHRMLPPKPTQSPQSSLSLSGSTTQTSALAVTTAAAANGGSANWHTAEHLGFDSCEYLTPSEMQTLWQYSPYYDEGIYLPGAIDAGCPLSPPSPLTATQWVSDAVNQGWGIIPIWFGLQPYCTLNTRVKKTWPSTETLQDLQNKGTSEANGKLGAEAEASQLGLSSSVIYFDMENWDTNDATCNQQVAVRVEDGHPTTPLV